MGIAGEQGLILQLGIAKGYFMRIIYFRIVKLSEFDQKRGNTRIPHALIVQHSGSWPEGENQPNLI